MYNLPLPFSNHAQSAYILPGLHVYTLQSATALPCSSTRQVSIADDVMPIVNISQEVDVIQLCPEVLCRLAVVVCDCAWK